MPCTGLRRRHWGRFGAAGLLVVATVDDVPHVLLDERADWVHQGGTIGVPGGAIHPGEQPIEAALREAGEEVVGLEDLQVDVFGASRPDRTTRFSSPVTSACSRPASRPTVLIPGIAANCVSSRFGSALGSARSTRNG